MRRGPLAALLGAAALLGGAVAAGLVSVLDCDDRQETETVVVSVPVATGAIEQRAGLRRCSATASTLPRSMPRGRGRGDDLRGDRRRPIARVGASSSDDSHQRARDHERRVPLRTRCSRPIGCTSSSRTASGCRHPSSATTSSRTSASYASTAPTTCWSRCRWATRRRWSWVRRWPRSAVRSATRAARRGRRLGDGPLDPLADVTVLRGRRDPDGRADQSRQLGWTAARPARACDRDQRPDPLGLRNRGRRRLRDSISDLPLARATRCDGRVSYAYIGIESQDVTPGLARRFRLGVPRGALVTRVRSDTPAGGRACAAAPPMPNTTA